MITFILNDKEINTGLPAGMLLLDFVRYNQHLSGTKIGCREGDCGACTVLTGQLKNGALNYQSVTSCLTPLGNIHLKHVVTVEGLNMSELNPIQQAMCDEGGTQCGFCTPGFIVSMAGFCLSQDEPAYKNAVAAVDGNICRCTGYKSIERALSKITALMQDKKGSDPVEYVTTRSILPAYFNDIKERLAVLSQRHDKDGSPKVSETRFLGGGTDLYVQQHEALVDADIDFLMLKQTLKGIGKEGGRCVIGGATTVSDLAGSPVIREYFPGIGNFSKLISSTPIRNLATLAGNFINASPIGDFSIFFLALDTEIELTDSQSGRRRHLPLRQLYKGYKQLDKQDCEYVSQFWFSLPGENTLFHFEKVSKRTHLDIASVNTAVKLVMNGNIITDASLSAGGVAPVPLFLNKTSASLKGKRVNEELVIEATQVVQTEIAPISDARGTEEYKRFLLSQLIKAHFIKLFPALQADKLLGLRNNPQL